MARHTSGWSPDSRTRPFSGTYGPCGAGSIACLADSSGSVSIVDIPSGRVVRTLLDRSGMLGDLEVLIFSDEAGVPKPDPGLFMAALAGLEATPEQAVHIGDTRSTDIAGARGVGMASVRIRIPHDDRTEGPEADAVADSHLEIRAILGLC